MKKIKFVSLLLSLLLLFSVLPVNMLSAGALGGNCGENIAWSFDDVSGKLTLTGSGAMTDYTEQTIPWPANKVKSLEISSDITYIGNYAFYGCVLLGTVELPNGVEEIGESAFRYCNILTDVSMPSSVKKIGENAFGWCVSLKNVKIPQELETIDDYAFYYCTSMTSFDIPSTVKSIGKGVFYNCRNLLSSKVPDGITALPDDFYRGCESLGKVELPDSITSIGENAFRNCLKIKNVDIPSKVTTIGNAAFMECSELTELAIPGGVSKIQGEMFKNCIALTKIRMPASVTEVSADAFYGCRAFTDVYYCGNSQQKAAITIGKNNSRLSGSTWHYALCEENGHTPDEWHTDENGHYHICTVCGETFDEGEHKGGTATLTDKPVCEECGESYGEVLKLAQPVIKVVSNKTKQEDVKIEIISKTSGETIFEATAEGENVEYKFPEIEPQECKVIVSKSNHVKREYDLSIGYGEVVLETRINLLGDVNGDGSITTADFAVAAFNVNQTVKSEGYDFELLDINGDGKVNMLDLSRIVAHIQQKKLIW